MANHHAAEKYRVRRHETPGNASPAAVHPQNYFRQVDARLHEALALDRMYIGLPNGWYELHTQALEALNGYAKLTEQAQGCPHSRRHSPEALVAERKLATAGIQLVKAIRRAATVNPKLLPLIYAVDNATRVRREGPCL